MEKTRKPSTAAVYKVNSKKMKKKKNGPNKKDVAVTRNVLKAMRLDCHRETLVRLYRQDKSRYRKLVKKCRPFRTKLDGHTPGKRVFFVDPGTDDTFCAASQHPACWVRASLSPAFEDNANGTLYNRPNEKVATPMFAYYWRDADEQYQPLIEYAQRKDVNLRLLVVRPIGGFDKPLPDQLTLLAKARRSARKLLRNVEAEAAPKKQKRKRSKEKKRAKQKKEKTEDVPQKKRRSKRDNDSGEEDDDFIDSDEDVAESWSDADDDSYAPSLDGDDSGDESADTSSGNDDAEIDDDLALDSYDDDGDDDDDSSTSSSSGNSSADSDDEISTTY